MSYFEAEDVIHIALTGDAESGSVELSPNITAELNAKGELIGLEILHASTFLRDMILDTAQGKLLERTASRE
jgi:uncharacterized protein YuzE